VCFGRGEEEEEEERRLLDVPTVAPNEMTRLAKDLVRPNQPPWLGPYERRWGRKKMGRGGGGEGGVRSRPL
jgi:hypothetical protein